MKVEKLVKLNNPTAQVINDALYVEGDSGLTPVTPQIITRHPTPIELQRKKEMDKRVQSFIVKIG